MTCDLAHDSSKTEKTSLWIQIIPIKPNISVWNPFNHPYNRLLCRVFIEIPRNRQYFVGRILLTSPPNPRENSEFRRFLASLQLLCGAGLVPSAVTFNTGAHEEGIFCRIKSIQPFWLKDKDVSNLASAQEHMFSETISCLGLHLHDFTWLRSHLFDRSLVPFANTMDVTRFLYHIATIVAQKPHSYSILIPSLFRLLWFPPRVERHHGTDRCHLQALLSVRSSQDHGLGFTLCWCWVESIVVVVHLMNELLDVRESAACSTIWLWAISWSAGIIGEVPFVGDHINLWPVSFP